MTGNRLRLNPLNLIEFILTKGSFPSPKAFSMGLFSFVMFFGRGGQMSDLKNFNNFSIFDKTGTVALFVTIALAIICLVIYLVADKKSRESIGAVKKVMAGFIIGYAVALVLLLGFLKLDEYSADGYIVADQFYPVLAFVLTVVVLAIANVIVSLFKKDKFKLCFKISAAIVIAFFFALLIALGIKNNTMTLSTADNAMLYIFTIVIVLAIAAVYIFVGKKLDDKLHTKSIVYAAISIALSFALSYIRFFELPQGGSITLCSILPMLIYSYMFGTRRGIMAGIIYGFLQFIQAPWFYHPVQFLLDYPIAFAALGVAGMFKEMGLFKNKQVVGFALGAFIAGILRYFSHVISGVFIFGSADASYTAVAWSFLYNSFVFADLAIALVAGLMMFSSKAFVARLDINVSVKKSDAKPEPVLETAVQSDNVQSDEAQSDEKRQNEAVEKSSLSMPDEADKPFDDTKNEQPDSTDNKSETSNKKSKK